MTCPTCHGRGYTVSEHSDEHGVYQDTHECEECRHYLSETCACCGHWQGAHHEDPDGSRTHCEAAGCLCPEYMTIEGVMIDEHVRLEKMRDAARVACRRLRIERDEARNDAAANRRRVELFGNALLGGLREPVLRLDPSHPDELALAVVAVECGIISGGKARELLGLTLDQWRAVEMTFDAAVATLREAKEKMW